MAAWRKWAGGGGLGLGGGLGELDGEGGVGVGLWVLLSGCLGDGWVGAGGVEVGVEFESAGPGCEAGVEVAQCAGGVAAEGVGAGGVGGLGGGAPSEP